MDESWQKDILKVITGSQTLTLATLGHDGPEASMATFSLLGSTILLHLSDLARHTKNIHAQPNIGLLISAKPSPSDSPLNLPRLSLQGNIHPVDMQHYTSAKSAYLAAIPEAEPLFTFSDFTLYAMHPSRIFWVGGFGNTRKITTAQWAAITCL